MILNLNLYLNLFSNCFINIVTYTGLNFIELEHPVILSELHNYRKTSTLKRNESNDVFRTDIPSRPQNCEAHILIPRLRLEDKIETLDTSTASQWTMHSTSLMESIISTRMRYDVLISTKDFRPDLKSWVKKVASKVLSGSGDRKIPPTMSWEVLFFSIETSIMSNCGQKKEKDYIIIKVDLLCHHCHPECLAFKPILIHSKMDKQPLTEQKLSKSIMKLNENTDKITWVLYENFTPRKVFGNFKYPKNKKEALLFSDRSSMDKLIDEILLFHAFGNSSFCTRKEGSERYKVCRSSHLQWVSCGHLTGTLPYLEILSPYKIFAWVAIIISILLLPILLTVIERASCTIQIYQCECNSSSQTKLLRRRYRNWRWRTTYFNYFLGILKPIVDQGPDEISKAFTSFAPLRIAITLYLLMIIILSNGYKGENITKLVSPIPPIPFTTFEELVSKKYEIFSTAYEKSGQYNIAMPKLLKKFGPDFLEKQSFNMKGIHEFDLSHYDNFSRKTYRLRMRSALSFSLMGGSSRRVLSKREDYFLKNTRMNLRRPIEHERSTSSSRHSGLAHVHHCSATSKFAMIDEKESIYRFQCIDIANDEDKTSQFPLSFGKEILATITRGFTMLNWAVP
ncbi:unnamed protein product [Orchesella dallaii]|uniref:Uncharacterized protein n=1 Tax=Orchesella dallaii TaxID=48710 RepID=A0ABP1S9W0_9HEXA